ncbi:MAG: EAL domain-containing protein [Lachnospiraceae bacterium]|nr:EAL domain-containing protein [Lachnospiraceae bacterium]
MSAPSFTRTQLEDLMRAVTPLYDFVRLVDPGECRVLKSEGGERQKMSKPAKADGRCYDLWGQGDRCWNCSSYRAVVSGRLQEKVESLDGSACRVISVPIMQQDEAGELHACCLEFVRLLEQSIIPGEEPEEEEADGCAYEEKCTDRDKSLQIIMEALGRHSSSAIVCMDTGGNCIYANEAAFRMFRIRNELKDLKSFLDGWLERDMRESGGRRWIQSYEQGRGRRCIDVEYFQINASGDEPLGSYYSFTDVTKLTDGDEQTGMLRALDPLTGLYDWEGFREKARKYLSQHEGEAFLLIRVNIKDFKLVNQLFGRKRGDDTLRAVAYMCRDLAVGGDVYGRIINDSFAILTLAEHFDENRYRTRALQVVEQFGNPIYKLHLQFGIYRLKKNQEDIAIMCDRAMMAIKSIKDDHVLSFAEYTNDMIVNALYESEVVSSFEEALKKGQVHIYLQPQNSHDGRLIAAEALARWIHPEQGVIPPDRFIPVLERAGMIHELDRYIWEKAVRQLRDWKGTKKENVRISVNISPRDIAKMDLESVFLELVNKYGVEPSKLNLEITETAVMADPQACIDLVQRLQKAGFAVEIDDFGSGYSSLNLLKDVHANILKIDRIFLARTEQEKRAEVILTHIINMARDLDMGVITEGVENERQLEMLHKLGCDMFQGFLFSKPISVNEFEKKYFNTRIKSS